MPRVVEPHPTDADLVRAAVRALARFAPGPDAVEAAEQFMRNVPPAGRREGGAV